LCHAQAHGAVALTGQRVLREDQLNTMFAEAADLSSLGTRRGIAGVLDTDFIRDGLQNQLTWRIPPSTVRSARAGSLRLFMEYNTLTETSEKLPKFAGQLGVPVAELRRILNEDWLPHIEVVQLPSSLRAADPRALAVRDRDAADYPAAALAALLSPCLLLTRNYKHFGPLGVRTYDQGRDGVLAVAEIRVGETRVQAALMLPAVPLRAAGAGMKWACDRFGPGAWVVLAFLIGGGIYWYCRQPPERRDRVREVAGTIGTHLLDEYSQSADGVFRARLQLRACMVPRPEVRAPAAAIMRELALAPESLSAAQLAEQLEPAIRLRADRLREFLREHDGTVFDQVRRGGYVLGSRYELPD